MSLHDGKIMLLVAFLPIGFVVVLGVILGRIARRARRSSFRGLERENHSDRSRTYLGGPDADTPLSQRKVTMRVCRECRELVLLDAAHCKYCGAVQSAVPVSSSSGEELPLRIPSRKEGVSKPNAGAAVQSIHHTS